MSYTLRDIYILIFLIALNIEGILVMLKLRNITSTNSYYDLLFLGVAIINKDNKAFWLSLIILTITIIIRYLSKKYSYTIENIVSENLTDINFIIKRYLKRDNDIEIEYKKSSIILKGMKPNKREIKPMLYEINHYLRGNGKISTQNIVKVVGLIFLSILVVYIGVIK